MTNTIEHVEGQGSQATSGSGADTQGAFFAVGDRTPGELLKADLARNKGNGKGMIVVPMFRLAQSVARRKETSRLSWLAGVPYLVAYRVVVEWFMGIEVPAKTDVGAGLVVQHGQSLVVNCHTHIGDNVLLRSGVVIGNKVLADGTESACPVLGNDVEIGANAVIIGPIHIGDGARIGASAVVTKDVPAGGIARGNPAQIIAP